VISSCNATVALQRQGSQLPRGRNDIQRIRPVFSRFFQAMMIADHDRTQPGVLNPSALTPANLARLRRTSWDEGCFSRHMKLRADGRAGAAS
jgi:hypothetical protein